jgi:hypothetical protein
MRITVEGWLAVDRRLAGDGPRRMNGGPNRNAQGLLSEYALRVVIDHSCFLTHALSRAALLFINLLFGGDLRECNRDRAAH